MRILFLSDRIPPDNAGGAEKVIWSLAKGLQAHGHDIHIIAATPEAPFNEVRDGINSYHIHVKYPAPNRLRHYLSLFNPQVNKPLKDLYKQIRPDIINAGNIHSDLTYFSLVHADNMGIPTVFTSQDVMPFSYTKLTHYINPATCAVEDSAYQLPRFYNFKQMKTRYNPLRNPIIRHILTDHTRIRTAGSETHRKSLEANNLPPFRVIHGSVIQDYFIVDEETVTALRERLDLSGKKVILFAGRLTKTKGSEQILATLEKLVERMPEAILLTLTRASLEQQGLNNPRWQHLQKNICIGGWMQGKELAAAYQVADVAVVPSICMDTFPTINLEAMAARKPVIATCYGGSPEAIIDGQTGYIINPFNTEQFVDRLCNVLSDAELAKKMGEAGYQHYLNHFTPEKHSQRMLALYQELLD